MRRRKGKNKKSKRRTYSYQGMTFKSKGELYYAQMCDELRIPYLYESERLDWVPPRKKYTIDFIHPKKDGGKMWIEKKGFLRKEDKEKMIAIKAQYPHLDIRFLFEKASKPVNNYIRKDGTKMSHGEWAEKHNYVYAEGKIIPKEWIKEIAA